MDDKIISARRRVQEARAKLVIETDAPYPDAEKIAKAREAALKAEKELADLEREQKK